MKEEAAEEQKNQWYGLGIILYCSIGFSILWRILEKGLSIPFPFAAAISTLFLLLTSYPIFVRGKTNRWMKRKWNFRSWLLVTAVLTILMGFYGWVLIMIFFK